MTKNITLTFRILFALYITSLSCLCFLNISSFTSGMDIPGYILGIRSDRIVHFLMFLPFASLASPAFIPHENRYAVNARRVLHICLAGVLYAAATELIQEYFITMREGDTVDFLADVTGLAAGLPLYLFILLPFINRISHSSASFSRK